MKRNEAAEDRRIMSNGVFTVTKSDSGWRVYRIRDGANVGTFESMAAAQERAGMIPRRRHAAKMLIRPLSFHRSFRLMERLKQA